MTSKNDINSCNTCILKLTLSQTTPESEAKVEEICKEVNRRNLAVNRIIDIGSSDDKTELCAIGSEHFKTRGKDCEDWIPDIGLTLSDALFLRMDKKMHTLSWRVFWVTVVSVIIAFLSFVLLA